MDLLAIATLLLTPVTGIITWMAARKRNKADLNRTEIENADLVSGVFQKTIAALEKQVQDLLEIVGQLRSENLNLSSTIYILKQEIAGLKESNTTLINEIHKHEKQIDATNAAIDVLADAGR